jgi:hypothetical protein
MLSDVIAIAVAVGGGGLVALSIKQARAKGWAGSLQMAAAGFLLIGAAAIGVVGFLAGLVLNPLAWLGVIALGIAGLLFAAGQRLEGRAAGKGGQPAVEGGGKQQGTQRKAVEGRKRESAVDEDMAEIEEILRRHGIE